MVCVGCTVCVPEEATCPRPTIDTFVASVVFHVSTELPPGAIVLGFAVIVAIGAGAVSGAVGGGGGAGFFLWHPATVSSAARLAVTTRNLRFEYCTCLSSFKERNCGLTRTKRDRIPARSSSTCHFQLQLGIVLLPPPWVSCC